jgi:hypothetical protein
MGNNGETVVKESKFTKRWGLIREKGKARYILVYGVLFWGIPMLVFMSFITNPFTNGLFSAAALIHCIVWLIGGLVYGFVMWHYSEYKFTKEQAKHGSK